MMNESSTTLLGTKGLIRVLLCFMVLTRERQKNKIISENRHTILVFAVNLAVVLQFKGHRCLSRAMVKAKALGKTGVKVNTTAIP